MDNSELERLKIEKLPPGFLAELPPGAAKFVEAKLRQDYEIPSGEFFRGNREYRLCSLAFLLIPATILVTMQYVEYPALLLSSKEKWIYIAFCSGSIISSLMSYPPSARVTGEGIQWRHRFRRKFLAWDEIDYAGIGGHCALVVYGTNDRAFDFRYRMDGQGYLCDLIQRNIESHRMNRKYKESVPQPALT
jgi:hypothetical protein